MKKQIYLWNELKEAIQKEMNPRILHEKFYLQDNFAILLYLTESKQRDLELFLETFSKVENFQEIYKAFQLKGYKTQLSRINYRANHSKGLAEWFYCECNQITKHNANITFHPFKKGYEKQLYTIKKSVLEITEKLEQMNIVFETARPASRHNPIVI